MIITKSHLERWRTKRGGIAFTYSIKKKLGIPHNPKHGWYQKLEGQYIPDDQFSTIETEIENQKISLEDRKRTQRNERAEKQGMSVEEYRQARRALRQEIKRAKKEKHRKLMEEQRRRKEWERSLPPLERARVQIERAEAQKKIKREETDRKLYLKAIQQGDLKSYSYFIGSAEMECIKIGQTSGPIEKRLAGLQTGCPYKLVVLATTAIPEKLLHLRFAKDRVEGEWFRWSPDLLHFLEHLPRGFPKNF